MAKLVMALVLLANRHEVQVEQKARLHRLAAVGVSRSQAAVASRLALEAAKAQLHPLARLLALALKVELALDLPHSMLHQPLREHRRVMAPR